MTRLMALGVAIVLIGGWTCGPPKREWRSVFSDASWYRERSEPERDFQGVLQRRTPIASPNARLALRYSLDDKLAIYAPTTDALEPFVGRAVIIRGKEIDLTREGYGRELWPGAIAAR